MTINRIRKASLLLTAALALFATALPACAQGPASVVPQPREGAWMEVHNSFLVLTKKGHIDLLFLGDSITQMWNENSVWRRFYEPRHAANFGIGGDRTQHVLWRIQNGELDGIEPKVTVLMIGTNNLSSDTPDEIAQGIGAIVSELRRRLPKTQVLLLGIFPRAPKPNAVRERLKSVNEKIAKLDDGTHVRYLDIGKAFLSDDGSISRDVMPDSLHLSLKGYRIWADAMEPTLWSMLDEPTPLAAQFERETNTPSGPGEKSAPVDITAAQIRSALARALTPLERSLVVYAEKRDCFSCHNQTVPLVALKIARSRGVAINEDAFDAAIALTLNDLESAIELYQKGRGQPGGATRAAYALWALETGNHSADLITATVSDFLLNFDRDLDHWTTSSRRVPMEASPFTVTALTVRGLRTFGASARSDVVKERIGKARSWLAKSRPADTEDSVFRLWGLNFAAAPPEETKVAAKELLVAQRTDGGWAQIDALASDAYATGSVLVALHEAGGLPTDDPAYRSAVAFLLRTQKDDGTWFVASRSRPFQPYFESGFPYGKDQFIAVAASGWAAAALALALPPVP
jgi:lysophospholipase L1-like esterase